MITSRKHPLLQQARALASRGERRRLGLAVAEGLRLVESAVEAGVAITACLHTPQFAAAGPRGAALLKKLEASSGRMLEVQDAAFRSASAVEEPQGIMVIFEPAAVSLDRLDLSPPRPRTSRRSPPLVVVLDHVQDPGNVGAVIRTADAAGAAAVLLTPGCADPMNAKALRASMGSAFHLPVLDGLEVDAIATFLHRQRIPLFATGLEPDAKSCFDADLSGAVAVAFGNEGAGLSPGLMRANLAATLRIPILGGAESLNIAASAAVILFEVLRQSGTALR